MKKRHIVSSEFHGLKYLLPPEPLPIGPNGYPMITLEMISKPSMLAFDRMFAGPLKNIHNNFKRKRRFVNRVNKLKSK